MKKTTYFTHLISWSQVEQGCEEVIKKRDDYINSHKNRIREVESEDLKVEFVGNNNALCILRFTFYEKQHL